MTSALGNRILAGMSTVALNTDVAAVTSGAVRSAPQTSRASHAKRARDPVRRVLLLVNRSSGTGHDDTTVRHSARLLRKALDTSIDLCVEEVADHRLAGLSTAEFLASSRRPAAIIVAGGGGTLRAVVDAVCDHRDASPVGVPPRIAALRMGSGNVVARRLGIDADPATALVGVTRTIERGTTVAVHVMRCGVGRRDGTLERRCAVTMCGLGQFGRTSGDLARWHRHVRPARARASDLIGLERLNTIEYALAALVRGTASMVRPTLCERVRVSSGGRGCEMRLLAGAVMNLRVGGLPDPRVDLTDPSLSLLLIQHRGMRTGRIETWRVDAGDRLEIELLDRASADFFLDEDPDRFWGRLTFESAGCVEFIPGRDIAASMMRTEP